jgi:predicted TIM-barrel enzyme
VLVLADVQVKYAAMVVPRPLRESARLAALHGADAVILSGTRTGEPPALDDLHEARAGAGGCPVLVGSGTDATNAASLLAAADGAIVATSLLRDGRADADRVAALLRARG